MLEQHLPDLVRQIRVTAPTILVEAAQIDNEQELRADHEDVAQLRAQVESLRNDLRKAAWKADEPGNTGQAGRLAPIPAAVPQPLPQLRPTPDMLRLKALLLGDGQSGTMAVTSEQTGVSAHGMGGAG